MHTPRRRTITNLARAEKLLAGKGRYSDLYARRVLQLVPQPQIDCIDFHNQLVEQYPLSSAVALTLADQRIRKIASACRQISAALARAQYDLTINISDIRQLGD